MRQPEHIQALQEVGCGCLGGTWSQQRSLCALALLSLGSRATAEIFLHAVGTWAASTAAASWLELLSVTGKGCGAKRLLCSPSGCLSGNEELKIFLRSGTRCLLLALSEYECLFFTELRGNGYSEVFRQLWYWDGEAVVMSSVKDVLSILIFGANDPADSMYRRCQPALFCFFLSIFFASFVGFSFGFALIS